MMWSENEPRDDDGRESGAVILPFPSVGATGDQMRLRRALAALDTAMAEQRQAVAEWQLALSELSTAVGGLDGALRAQDRALGALANNVAGLNSDARRLEAWSDAVLGTSS